jgi:hypothetical protein
LSEINLENSISCEPGKPIVSKVTSLKLSFTIFANNELSNPPEKAIAKFSLLATLISIDFTIS